MIEDKIKQLKRINEKKLQKTYLKFIIRGIILLVANAVYGRAIVEKDLLIYIEDGNKLLK